MLSLPLLLAITSLAIWIVLTLFRGAFWQLHRFDDDTQAHRDLPSWPRIVGIVPARNEAQTITHAVQSLVQQDYPGKFHVILVDDHSDDNTASLARHIVQETAASNRFTILESESLPAHWTGKLWALQQGSTAAIESAPDYFWFTDADIVHAPDTLRRLVFRAETAKLDLTSLMVLLQSCSLSERLLIPPFLYFFLKLYPPGWVANPTAHTAGAAGGCILLDRKALERIGGFTSIRSEVIDDCALARAVKRSGGAIWMGLTRRSVSFRQYATFREICDLIARTAFTQLKYSPWLLIATLLGMFLTYILPVALALGGRFFVWRISLIAWALMTITYLPTIRFYGLSPLWSLSLPLAAIFYSYATCVSALRYWLGRGGQWKGRTQAVRK